MIRRHVIRSCWWPTAARSPGGSCGPPGPWASPRWRCTRTPMPGPHVAEADLAVRLPGVAPAETYLRSTLILDAAVLAGPTPSTRVRLPVRSRGDFARACVGRRARLGGAAGRRHRRHGLEDRLQGLMRGRRRAHPAPRSSSTATTSRRRAVAALGWPCWSRRRPVAGAGHAGGARARASWPTRRGRAARGGGGVRRRHRLPGALRDRAAPHRGAGAGRRLRRNGGAVRAGVQHPAPAPEDRGGGAFARGHPRARRRSGRRRRPPRPGRRIRQRRHRRVRGGRRTASPTSSR